MIRERIYFNPKYIVKEAGTICTICGTVMDNYGNIIDSSAFSISRYIKQGYEPIQCCKKPPSYDVLREANQLLKKLQSKEAPEFVTW